MLAVPVCFAHVDCYWQHSARFLKKEMSLGKIYEKKEWNRGSPDIWELERIEKPSISRLQMVRRKTEKGFEGQRPIKTQPWGKDQIKNMVFFLLFQ